MIDKLTLGPLGVNTYFVIDKDTKRGVIVDPGDQAHLILDKIAENNWDIRYIFLTHGHYDHIGAAQEIKKELGCSIVAHENAKEYLENSNHNLSTALGSAKVEFEADKYIRADEESYKDIFDNLPEKLSAKILHAPGHTTDSIIYYFESYDAAFVGDVIFRESMGRADLHGGHGPTLISSIKNQVFTLPQETVLYPGHGPSTTVRHEIHNNPYFNLGY